ncbi:MAG: HlyD family efflux transporter periplasmic adaptor subunit [Candidatus Pacebacteria bacterium]|jgi:multidrug efflux pump subunit AcrA (membrane-fusion protein)|nr:HlyD family efflux transporter periplasmic adaptor subunit [Candidatus Paceibacterota bacterium]
MNLLENSKGIWKFASSGQLVGWMKQHYSLSAALIIGIGAVLVLLFSGSAPEEAPATAKVPEVKVGTVSSLTAANTATFVGTVRAVSEADIQTDRGGRVTSVRVAAGARVAPGTIIATLENASEQASVLQAQGAYQAALAASRQSTLGVAEANTALESANRNAVTAVSSAYNTTAGVVQTDIDIYFSNPNSALPGLRTNGFGETLAINSARVALQSTLTNWQRESLALTAVGNLDRAVEDSRRYVGEVISLTDSLISALSRDTDGGADAAAARATQIDKLTTARGSLLGVQSSLQGTLSNLDAARDAKTRAEINASNNTGASAADAQITQALGSLRAAQANLEKTILRTPIGGVVEVLRIKTGDFLTPQTSIARVAGAQGLEVSIFAGENDRNLFAVGDTVTIGETATGTVVNIAPAIDSLTQKTEIKVAITGTDLVNGDTVSVALGTTTSRVNTTIQVPITALKFTDTAGSIFVVENDRLKQVPVEVGAISGSLVTIESGLDATTEFVLDARGRVVDEQVTVVRD